MRLQMFSNLLIIPLLTSSFKDIAAKESVEGASMNRCQLEARELVEQVLLAAHTKDKILFEKSFFENQELFALFPWGKIVNGYEEFMKSQKDFFSNDSVEFSGKIIRSIESNNVSQFGAEVDLKNKNGEKKKIYISYVLHLENECWKIVSIQNTYLN